MDIESFLTKNDERWLMYHSAYRENALKYIFDDDYLGFIAIYKYKTPIDETRYEVYFALVDEEHRREGRLRRMVKKMRKKYKGKKLILQCDSDAKQTIWERVGFKLDTKGVFRWMYMN